MKICPYCKTKNRDEAIFCSHCRRPVQAAQPQKANPLLWLLVAFILIGLGFSLYSFRLLPGQTRPPIFDGTPAAGPAPTRTRKPIVLSTCVGDITRIRRAPGTESETIGGLVSGTCLTILGRNEAASWVYIVSEDYQTGWVDASLLTDAGDLSRVSVRGDSAMAASGRPTLTSAEIAHGAQAYLTQVSATNIPGSPFSRHMAPCFEMADRIGDNVSCRMERAYCDYLPALEGSPTVCNDRPYPDQIFALVVFGQDWSDYDGQCLIVSGFLEINRGALQIQAFNRSQVSYCE
jgi:hypothetical protein